MKSTARLFGADTRRWLWGFIGATIVLMGAAVVALPLPPSGILSTLVALGGVWALGWHMVWQMRRLKVEDPASCRAVFLANRDAGLIAALFLAAAVLL